MPPSFPTRRSSDLRIMRIVGYPRMDVTVLQEVIERNVPPNIKDNPTEIRAYVSRELDTNRGVIAGLSARDAFVHSDAITAEIINDKNPSACLQIETSEEHSVGKEGVRTGRTRWE